jgi:hypothetical protein
MFLWSQTITNFHLKIKGESSLDGVRAHYSGQRLLSQIPLFEIACFELLPS